MKGRLRPEDVQERLARIEASEPFAHDPTGLSSLRRSLVAVEELFASLHATDPAVFWITMGLLSVVMTALVAHLIWSLWAVVRVVREGAVHEVPPSPRPCLKAEARSAIQRGDSARAIELLWEALCEHFGGSNSDTPRRQLSRLQLDDQGMVQARTLLQLHERASFSARGVQEADARRALKILSELEVTQ